MRTGIAYLSFIFLIIFATQCFSSDIENFLDELVFVDLQTSAVSIEMYKYLGWIKERDAWGEASLRALKELESIEEWLLSLNFPERLLILRDSYREIIRELKSIYKNIEDKSDDTIKNEFKRFKALHYRYSERLKSFLKDRNSYFLGFLSPLNEILKTVDSEEDKVYFLKAIELMELKKYREAYRIFENLLKERYSDSIFGDSILLKMTDCLLHTDTDLKRENLYEITEKSLQSLKQIMDKKRYSPVLYEVFYKWRTVEQEFRYGMFNVAEIPNREYNKIRWELVKVIKNYLKENPHDEWAKIQVRLLLDLPNIRRGGISGNDNLTHWSLLYTDLFEKRKEER